MTTPVATPQTGDELEELFNDKPRLKATLEDATFPGLIRNYVEKFVAAAGNEDLRKRFDEQVQVGLQDFMRDQADRNGARPPEGWKPGMGLAPASGQGQRRARAVARSKARDAAQLFDRQGLFSPTALGAAEGIDNSEYANTLKQFVWATLKGASVAQRDGNRELGDKMDALKSSLAKALEVRNATSLSERVPSEGGFLIPENLRSEILALTLEDAVMRPEATVIPMDSLRVPLPSIDDTSHASNVFGGVSAFWTAEGAALTASAPKFSRIVLTANKLTAYTQIPNELLQDSATPMDVWFNTFFPQAIAFFEDNAFLVGDGVDQPEGLLNCPGAVSVDPAVSATVQLGDVLTMLARLWPPSLKRARWVCSPDMLGQLLQMGLAVAATNSGTTTLTPVSPPSLLGGMQAIEAPAGSDGTGFNYRLLGIPLRVSEKIPFPSTGQPDGALTLYDPSGYLIGDRQAMQIATSAEFSFANDEVSYRVIERVDGRGWQRSALAPANGSPNKLSMIVKLGQTHS